VLARSFGNSIPREEEYESRTIGAGPCGDSRQPRECLMPFGGQCRDLWEGFGSRLHGGEGTGDLLGGRKDRCEGRLVILEKDLGL